MSFLDKKSEVLAQQKKLELKDEGIGYEGRY
jgi:hypothetical protein